MSRMSKEHDEVESWDEEQQLVPPCHTEKGVDSGGAEMAPGKSLKPVPLCGGTYPHAGSQAPKPTAWRSWREAWTLGFWQALEDLCTLHCQNNLQCRPCCRGRRVTDESILSTFIPKALRGPAPLTRPHSGAWISRSLIRGPFPEHPLCPWLSRGWTVNQTKSLSSGATIPMVTMPRIQITRDLQTPSYLKRPVNLRESTSLLAGVFLAPFHR